MNKIALTMAALLLTLPFARAADAAVYVSLSAPAYYAPPVVYSPPPVAYVPPPQYVAAPPPVVYSPVAYAASAPAVIVESPVYYGYGWHYHHWH
ncbi:MAG TPA: hypothetical protein VFT64_03065 [Rickettsiales bacterium]|nr:hypothetical protein [Rickettsiales bacterium]